MRVLEAMSHSQVRSPTTGTNTFEAYQLASNKSATPSLSPPDGLPVGGLRKTEVDVGVGTGTIFSSNNITEPVGTIVEFNFNPKVCT